LGFWVTELSKCPNRIRINNLKKISIRIPKLNFLNISVRIPKILNRVANFQFENLITDIFKYPYNIGMILKKMELTGDMFVTQQLFPNKQWKICKYEILNSECEG